MLFVKIEELVNENINFLAHKKDNRIETLIEHTELCQKYYKKIMKDRNLDKIFKNIFNDIFREEMENKNVDKSLLLDLYSDILNNIVTCHDIGKINPLFQLNKMNNKISESSIDGVNKSNHSRLSAVLYMDFFMNRISERVLSLDMEKKLKDCILTKILKVLSIGVVVIDRHHSDLEENLFSSLKCSDYEQEFKNIINGFINKNCYNLIKELKFFNLCDNVNFNLFSEDSEKKNDIESLTFYALAKLVFSLLVASDYYSTTEFMSELELTEFGKIEKSFIENMQNKYENTDLVKSIRSNKTLEKISNREYSNINILRSEMFLEAEKQLIKNKDKRIFFLEAPTGSGKSNVALNLSIKLCNENTNKIIYVYPFNTLIEQNMATLTELFENTDIIDHITVINSITPIKIKGKKRNEEEPEEYDEKTYTEAFLDKQFLHYPFLIMSHVGLFNIFFNVDKKNAFSFYQMANSIIVLDEIQNYKVSIWSEIMIFLEIFSKLLNIKIIIMSATLPHLPQLIGKYVSDNNSYVNLIEERNKYFLNPLFRNRVNLNFDLLSDALKPEKIRKVTYEEILGHMNDNCSDDEKILVEFISKKDAYSFMDFCDNLKENDSLYKEIFEDKEILILTRDDNKAQRKEIIEKIRNRKGKVLLIATQVIECGVDIDMDSGYKNITFIDNEEQFLGRINRSCKKLGKAYFFYMKEAKEIYVNDIRTNIEYTLKSDEMKKILENKNMEGYYFKILSRIKEENEKKNETGIKEFYNDIEKLDFDKISKRMTLIDENKLFRKTIFFNREIIVENKMLSGSEIWEKYKQLLKDNKMNYSKKQIKLSEVRSEMQYFLYEVSTKIFEKFVIINDIIGEINYIEDGEKYFKDGRLNIGSEEFFDIFI